MRALLVGLVLLVAGCASTSERGNCEQGADEIARSTSRVWLASHDDRAITFALMEGSFGSLDAELLRRLGSVPASSSIELRPIESFFDALEPNPNGPDAAAPERLRDSLESLQGDASYAAVVDPQHAGTVRVIYAQRTLCDQIVWLESVAIEP